jgi:tryptophan synthase alpha subunit
MARRLMRSKDPDIRASFKALRRAGKRALELGLKTGTPVWVLKDGELVDLTRSSARRRRAS